jgi:hypothetical protein
MIEVAGNNCPNIPHPVTTLTEGTDLTSTHNPAISKEGTDNVHASPPISASKTEDRTFIPSSPSSAAAELDNEFKDMIEKVCWTQIMSFA